jgi:predicted RNase H-like nuclease (RuvC/YqgF family)
MAPDEDIISDLEEELQSVSRELEQSNDLYNSLQEAYDALTDELHKEETIRKKVPAVEAAWDHYQVLLKLANNA